MTLEQFQELKIWHLRHCQQAPLEAIAWNSVLTLWLCGWVGAPLALVLGAPLLALATLGLVFAPTAYVALRTALANRHRLRCDWLVTLR